jgi:hypothetical protein
MASASTLVHRSAAAAGGWSPSAAGPRLVAWSLASAPVPSGRLVRTPLRRRREWPTSTARGVLHVAVAAVQGLVCAAAFCGPSRVELSVGLAATVLPPVGWLVGTIVGSVLPAGSRRRVGRCLGRGGGVATPLSVCLACAATAPFDAGSRTKVALSDRRALADHGCKAASQNCHESVVASP